MAVPNDHIPEEEPEEAAGGWIDQKYRYDRERLDADWQDELFCTANSGGNYAREVLFHAYEFVGGGPQDPLLQAEYVVAVLPDPRSRNEMKLVIFDSGDSVCWKEGMVRFAASRLSTRETLGTGVVRCQQDDWRLLTKILYDMDQAPLCFMIFARRADVMNQDGPEKPNIRLFFPVKPYKIYATFALAQLQSALVA